MSTEPPEPYLTAVRAANLLDEAALAELDAWVARTAPDGPQAVANELVRRGWLTQYQALEVYRGRGAGLTLGSYVLLDLLGEGGMGRVFKARHRRLDREVALKVIRKEKLAKPMVLQRFAQEIRAAGQLAHPNVVLAFDADEADGVHFFSMEYVDGSDLTKLVRQGGPLPVPVACDYVRQAALGLQHAFEKRLVHRDVKPSNLLVTPRGQVKVLDLGLALLNDGGEGATRVTQENFVLGTPDFLAPEQAKNPQAVDIRADVYALGATLFYLLTGRPPFDGLTPADKLLQHVTAPPPVLAAFRPDAPPQLGLLIQWMMAKRPEDRPQTPAQVAMALGPFCPPPAPVSGPVPYAHPAVAPGYPAVTPAPVYAALPTAVPAMPAPPAAAPWPAPAPAASPIDVGAWDAEVAAPAAAADGRNEAPRRTRTRPQTGGPAWVKFAIIGGLALGGLGVAAAVAIFMSGLSTIRRDVPDGPAEAFTNAAGMKMLPLPGGSFTMGSQPGEPGRADDEGPTGVVTVSGPFFVSATEVTQAQYRDVMGSSPAVWPLKMRQAGPTPVDSVTWAEAVAFCKKLTAKDKGRRAGWAYRLPTEAEWEYAARAGTTTPFPYGNVLVFGKHAFFSLDREPGERGGLGEPDPTGQAQSNLPHPAGSAGANPWGLFDTAGNVWEWCADGYEADAYQRRAAVDPRGPDGAAQRVLRGGSWKEAPGRCRSAARRGEDPAARRDDVGFRVVFAPAEK